jgi:polysaccharide pyruvyl transferase WcaK-like protein
MSAIGISRQIFFVGNGSYRNRGCEAIVRGTMEILRREFGPDISVRAGVHTDAGIVREQNAGEADSAIRSFSVSGTGARLSLKWWAAQANKRLGAKFAPHILDLRAPARDAKVALELGGDNYSLDYGRPESFMAVDRFLLKRGIPVVLWGASVGPFDADREFAPRMFEHLRKLAAIFVRETESLEYLRANGVSENVHLVADPAFVMKPVEPAAEKIGFALTEGAIGINLSPLVARYRGSQSPSSNLKEWLEFCIGLVKSAASLKLPILLIPHVESASPENDDFGFLHALCEVVASEMQVPVQVLPRGLNAAELKWIIARCPVFAGARTHSTIAALSSGVPTLSIGYSLKARGINKDIFGHLDYCIPVSDLNAGNFTERLKVLLASEGSIRAQLKSRIPEMQVKSFGAGPLLRKVIS